MKLRDYQQIAVNDTYNYLTANPDKNPCVVIPTGGGKTLVIAAIVQDVVGKWSGRVLILAHIKELLEQAHEKLTAVEPDVDVGIYSAGLKSRCTDNAVVIAGIQSVYKRACELGGFDVIIIDEAHLIPPGGDGMYQRFLKESKVVKPDCRMVGLTATPYRMESGVICGEKNILNDVCHETKIKELIARGYLSNLITKKGLDCDTSSLHIRGGEFIAKEAEDLMIQQIKEAIREIKRLADGRKSVLIFTAGVDHCELVTEELKKSGSDAEFIIGETLPNIRADLIEQFKSGKLKYLVNVNVLTVGFDAPNVDCICLLRPTLSPGLYYQMVGRGFRVCEGKENCLILDFAGNIDRHGVVDQLNPEKRSSASGDAPVKYCPKCQAAAHTRSKECKNCGYLFETEPEAKHDTTAAEKNILSGEPEEKEVDIFDISYHVHTKKDADEDHPKTLRVEYHVNMIVTHKEWVCIEHPAGSFANRKARQWWIDRSLDPFPQSAQHAVDICEAGGIKRTEGLTLEKQPGEKYWQIKSYKLGEMPEPCDIEHQAGSDWPVDEEIPF